MYAGRIRPPLWFVNQKKHTGRWLLDEEILCRKLLLAANRDSGM